MRFWYCDDKGLHYADSVPETAASWGPQDERGVYNFRTEEAAEQFVQLYVNTGLVRSGKQVRLK